MLMLEEALALDAGFEAARINLAMLLNIAGAPEDARERLRPSTSHRSPTARAPEQLLVAV